MSDPPEGITLLHHVETLLAERMARYQQRFDGQEAAFKLEVAALREGTQERLNAQQAIFKLEIVALREATHVRYSEEQKALALARDIQSYKDEKANELREQINRERLLYASKLDLQAATEKIDITLAHLTEELHLAQGRAHGLSRGWAILLGVMGAVATVVTVTAAIMAIGGQ